MRTLKRKTDHNDVAVTKSKGRWYISSFLKGVNSAFDLLGINGVSLKTIRKRNLERQKKNSMRHDFSVVGNELRTAIKEYGKGIQHTTKS